MSVEPLIAVTLAGSAAIVLVLALRIPLRRRLGAGAAYALWAMVPLASVAAALPSAGTRISLPPIAVPDLVATNAATATATVSAIDALPTWFALWLAGCLATMLLQVMQQRHFLRRSGARLRRGRLYAAVTGPCVSGLLHPVILLPADFRERFDRRERRLVLAHEIAHLRSGDLFVNALAALLRALFWFNPLLHVAQQSFRLDQELACDARVLARFPEARRRYAGAMLKAQLGGAASMEGPGPLGCGWFATHPLKERISMLNNSISVGRRRIGFVAAALLATAATGLAWAAKPGTPAVTASAAADAAYVDARFTLRIGDGAEQRFRMVNRFGEPFLATVSDDAGSNWEAHFVATAADAGSIRLSAKLSRNGAAVAAPELLLHDGENGGVKVDAAAGQPALALDVVLQRSVKPPQG
ncbi:M56 family metallopeptidase [Tahibacter sp. UC22_41]|uniref:M56 family metallopeptidase n=1 Tax=Tahibacter sp. UC22_41 TaxID=3350178 RepID=UPI0036DD5585